MTTYRIKPLPTIKIELDKGIFTYRMNYGSKMWTPVYMWYIEGGDKRILVDSGSDVTFAREFRGVPAEEITSFEDALAGVGLKPEDIDLLIQTHLHWDHCRNSYKCKNAKVVVQETELKFAFAPHPVMANVYYKPLFNDLNFRIVQGRCEIEPGIELIPAPGHTPGVQAVAVDTEAGKAIISGFCCLSDNFDPPEEVREMWPVLPPGIHTDSLEGFDSALRIRGMADILIPQHALCYLDGKSIP